METTTVDKCGNHDNGHVRKLRQSAGVERTTMDMCGNHDSQQVWKTRQWTCVETTTVDNVETTTIATDH